MEFVIQSYALRGVTFYFMIIIEIVIICNMIPLHVLGLSDITCVRGTVQAIMFMKSNSIIRISNILYYTYY